MDCWAPVLDQVGLISTVKEKSGSRPHFALLDLIRFIAAVLVLGLHLGFWAWWQDGDTLGTVARVFPNYPRLPEGVSYLWFGWVGVQIFFVISGLVIAISAENSSALTFLRSRFLRIYPTVWICSSISFVVLLCAAPQAAVGTVGRYLNTLIVSPYPRWIDGVYWTLSLEIVFYAYIGLMLLCGLQKYMIHFGIGMGAASAAYVLGRMNDIVPGGWVFTLLLLRHGVFFSLGMMIWFLARSARLNQCARISLLLFLALFVAACVMEIELTATEKLAALKLVAPTWPPIVVWSVLIAGIFATVWWGESLGRVLSRVAGSLRVLGLATYPLYLSHQMLGGAVGSIGIELGMHRYAAIGVAALTSVALSISIALWLEPRFRKLIVTRAATSRVAVISQAAGDSSTAGGRDRAR